MHMGTTDAPALRLRQIELATRAHRSSAGSSSGFLAIVQWQSRSAFARVSEGLWRNSRAEPTERRPTSRPLLWQAMAWYLEILQRARLKPQPWKRDVK